MLNDITLNTIDRELVDDILSVTKETFSEHIPYKVFPSSIDRDATIVVFSAHFIECFREMLSTGNGGYILKMSEAERNVYYSYLEYQDGIVVDDPEMFLVVVELNNCVVNEIECKVETYLDQSFSIPFSWDTCPVSAETVSKTIKLSQELYDAKVAAFEIVDTTTYMIQLNGVTIKILLDGIILWQQ